MSGDALIRSYSATLKIIRQRLNYFHFARKHADWLHINSHGLSRASPRTTARPIHAKTNNTTPPTQPPRLKDLKK
jgi:hypothetical protein